MTKTQHPDGRRDLSLIRKSGSTARVLNLALVFERHGESEEFRERPLFRCQRLNRALIIKHTLRAHEKALFDRPELTATKIVFPFSATELGLGGISVMMGEKLFDRDFRKAVGDNLDEDDYAADFDLLHVLHEAPSFDPFLLREHLKRSGHEVARCFFDISAADIERMHLFVAGQIAPLTTLAFGATGRRAEKLSMRLAEKLMTDENAQMLEPLRGAMGLTIQDYREGVFAWKGFLYYKWILSDILARNTALVLAFDERAIVCQDRTVRANLERLRRGVMGRMEEILSRASAAVCDYDIAFEAFATGDAARFRAFLVDAPGRFQSLGEAIGAVKHIHAFWEFRFPPPAQASFDADEAHDVLQEFDRMLAGVELAQAAPAAAVAYI